MNISFLEEAVFKKICDSSGCDGYSRGGITWTYACGEGDTP